MTLHAGHALRNAGHFNGRTLRRTLRPTLRLRLTTALLGGLAALSAPWAMAQTDEQPLKVAVSIPPLHWMVDQLAGDFVDITTLVTPGNSPDTYDPTPRQVAALSSVPLYLAIGVPFEQVWLPRLEQNQPEMQVVHLEAGLKTRFFGAGEAHHHDDHANHDEHEDHADHDEHEDHTNHDEHEDHEAHAAHAGHDDHGEDQGEADPHLWLDPERMMKMIERTSDVLEAHIPEHASDIQANEQQLLASLDALDSEISQQLAPYQGRNFMIFHPSFGYFSDRYQLVQHAIETSGREPTPREMAQVIARAKSEKIGTIFVSGQFSQTAAKRIASSLNAKVAVLDPLAEDYPENLRQASIALRKGFELTDSQ
ncbi:MULTISPECIES: metal ABC transporter solute-binding protein, Zn/Mn family [Cobetia]|uniref:metal ABC transporter solute-binding protein, Zn/Mn family n=1 Tax=Cobetia TaxID=204286 RepID=UPI00046844A1|nr:MULTISPECIES: zinc ABC transporter substrate-binding protein [Cobetia]